MSSTDHQESREVWDPADVDQVPTFSQLLYLYRAMGGAMDN